PDPAPDGTAARPASAAGHRADPAPPSASPPPGRPGLRPAASGGEPTRGRRRTRRLLAVGSALAVAAAVSIVVVARPWAREASAQLPANSVSLIDPAARRGAPPPPPAPP